MESRLDSSWFVLDPNLGANGDPFKPPSNVVLFIFNVEAFVDGVVSRPSPGITNELVSLPPSPGMDTNSALDLSSLLWTIPKGVDG